MKNLFSSVLVCLYFLLAACNDSGVEKKRMGTDSTNEAMAITTPDSSIIKISEVKAMLRTIQDTLNKVRVINKKIAIDHAVHANIIFSTRTFYMYAIDREWVNNNPPLSLICWGYVITGDNLIKIRMSATSHDCVVSCMKYYRQGKLEATINWLCAGMCHNPAGQQEIRKAGQMAVQYALQTYGSIVPE